MRSSLKKSVVVITGASSGLGRAMALKLAKKGARLVLTARNEKALVELARRCQNLGAKAISIRADVTDEAELRQVADKALKTFGQVDAWINNAGVLATGIFEEIPTDVFRKVVETNFYGVVHGSRVVLPVFRAQGHGVLINVSAVEGKIALPYSTAYVASKFAVTGLSQSLRMELKDESNIHVCTVMPASIDTPFFQHAANYSGRAIEPVKPVYAVDAAARDIVGCIERPRAEVFIGAASRWQTAMKRPRKKIGTQQLRPVPASSTEGNIFVPDRHLVSTRGGWGGRDTRTEKIALGALAAFVVGVAACRLASSRANNGGRGRRANAVEQKVREGVIEVA